MKWLEKAVGFINDYMSGYILVFLLVGVGVFYTVKTRFIQVRCLGEGFKKVFKKQSSKNGKSGISPFQALATAVAAQVGTGNIVGASGAILVGGPGAIFWMWIIAFLGMATIYAEAVLAQKTKVVDKNGNPLSNDSGEISDSQKVVSKAGIWQKIVSFFKNLFGSNRTIIQLFRAF